MASTEQPDLFSAFYAQALEISETYGQALLESGMSADEVEAIHEKVLEIKMNRMKAEQPEVYEELKSFGI